VARIEASEAFASAENSAYENRRRMTGGTKIFY
jgi:hypothetical protein